MTPAVNKANDRACLDLVRRGDPAGAEALFARHAQAILRFAGRMTGNQAEAEEICQEVFVRLIDRCEQFDGRGSVASWLLSIAANACRDHLRRGRRRSALPLLAAVEVEAAGPSAIAALVDEEGARIVRAALAGLSIEQREALILARYHELPYAEIGRTLGISEGAVKTRVFRAMEILKDRLQDRSHDRSKARDVGAPSRAAAVGADHPGEQTERAQWTASKP